MPNFQKLSYYHIEKNRCLYYDFIYIRLKITIKNFFMGSCDV